MPLFRLIAVARRARTESRKARLQTILRQRAPERITEALFREMETTLAPVSRSYLRELLKTMDLPLDPWVRGVSLHSPDDLRHSLLAFAKLYITTEDRTRQRELRADVIEAKTRLRALISKTIESALRAERESMLVEVMTWLENPGIFDLWVKLKK